MSKPIKQNQPQTLKVFGANRQESLENVKLIHFIVTGVVMNISLLISCIFERTVNTSSCPWSLAKKSHPTFLVLLIGTKPLKSLKIRIKEFYSNSLRGHDFSKCPWTCSPQADLWIPTTNSKQLGQPKNHSLPEATAWLWINFLSPAPLSIFRFLWKSLEHGTFLQQTLQWNEPHESLGLNESMTCIFQFTCFFFEIFKSAQCQSAPAWSWPQPKRSATRGTVSNLHLRLLEIKCWR